MNKRTNQEFTYILRNMEENKTYTIDQIKDLFRDNKQSKLIKADLDPDMIIVEHRQKTVLMFAVEKKMLQLTELLLKKKPNLEHRSVDSRYFNSDGLNAFLYACLTDKRKIVELLLDAGADINSVSSKGRNGLMFASHYGMHKMASLLLEKGIEVNAQDNEGMTALMHLNRYMLTNYSYIGEFELLDILPEHDADLNIKDKKGQTALTHYVKKGEFWWTQILLEKGADPNASDDNILVAAENIEKNSFILKTLLKEHGAKEKPYWVEFGVKTECQECNQDVLINNPVDEVQCPACFQFTKINDKFWKLLLEGAEEFNSDKTQYYRQSYIKLTDPSCLACGKPLNTNIETKNSSEYIECASCGQKNMLTDPPEWFGKFMISYRHPVKILCDLQNKDGKIDGDKPVALKCSACSAVLSVTDQTHTSFNCDHCGDEQQLPEEVWRALHPGGNRKSWYILSE
jgi:ankyrin repeat protein/predicted RNA-binding Zn-ribbon protein involved in translation (DUF1610 family)